MKLRRFKVAAAVSLRLLDHSADAEPLVREMLVREAAHLRGPRGGRYEQVGEVGPLRKTEGALDDFGWDRVTYMATVWGRYVRPRRKQHVAADRAEEALG